ncbi:MFS transporter [Streptomyces sp. NPDC003691]
MTGTPETDAPAAPAVQQDRWSRRLALPVMVLITANVLADVAISSPLMVLPQLLDHYDTDQAAWLNASAMLAGAVWSPLLAKSSDVFGERRPLVATLLLAGAGSLVCLAAPDLWVFLLGRFLQGAALAATFLTVALTLRLCAPRQAMAVVGLVTSGSAIVGVVEPFLMLPVIERFGHRSVFLVGAVLAAGAALCVRAVVPDTPPLGGGGRIDVRGALLLGGGLGAVLAYASLGGDAGLFSGGMLALLTAGATALAGWLFLARRTEEPVVDLRALNRPILLTLLALLLAAGSFRSMMQLTGIVAQVPPDLGLGYGLGGGETVALLFAVPSFGIFAGGLAAGRLAGRFGPAPLLLGGIALGAAASLGMLAGVSALPAAVVCGALLGAAAGAISTSGYNLATALTAPERRGTVAGLVSVVLALGSVTVNVAGGEVLKATRIPGVFADGAPASTATGIHLYVLAAGALFALAALPALALTRKRSAAPPRESPARVPAA